MKQLERLTQQLTFRSGTTVVAAMVVLALLSTSARRIGLAVIASSVVGVSTTRAAADAGTAIRPFRVSVPDADLADLRRRLLATRWPDKETVSDRSQGVQLEKLQALVHYWGTGYDWRKVEAKLNALPQFVTNIDGVDIHFIHVRSRHPNALPVIVTHGWPGSIIEQLKIIGPLTDPTAHGGRAEDAFDVVIPSLPGYGFSGKPTGSGWDPDHIARAWGELMKRLGYTQTSRRAAIGARPFRARWRVRPWRDCAASTSTCRRPCQTKWRRPSAAALRRQDSRTKNARYSTSSPRPPKWGTPPTSRC
jgi:hypothetical protein